MPVWLVILIAHVVTFRVTWLFIADYVMEPYRKWAERRGGHLDYFATCPWCMSIYVGAAVSAVVVFALVPSWGGLNRFVLAGMLLFSTSAFTGIVASQLVVDDTDE